MITLFVLTLGLLGSFFQFSLAQRLSIFTEDDFFSLFGGRRSRGLTFGGSGRGRGRGVDDGVLFFSGHDGRVALGV